MTHTALLIHSLTQAHAQPREDRQRGKAQAERANERVRENNTQHSTMIDTLLMY